VEEHLITHKSYQEERAVGILQGGFATSHKPLDLAEVQGRYDRVFQKVQSSGGPGP
jgi:hypothetical protein